MSAGPAKTPNLAAQAQHKAGSRYLYVFCIPYISIVLVAKHLPAFACCAGHRVHVAKLISMARLGSLSAESCAHWQRLQRAPLNLLSQKQATTVQWMSR